MRKPSGYWKIKENVFHEAQKYKTKTEFIKHCLSGYKTAVENDWLKEMDWFEVFFKPKGFWDIKENALAEALKYKTRREFCLGSWPAYDSVCRNGWMEELEHFNKVRMANGYWDNKERVLEESKKYKTRSEFRCFCYTAYEVALNNGWLNEMIWFNDIKKPNGFWDLKDNVLDESKNYTTLKEFKKQSKTAYLSATKNGWISEMYWLQRKRKSNNYWCREKVFEESKKYTLLKDFREKSPSAYVLAKNNGWLSQMSWLKIINNKSPKQNYAIYVYVDNENNKCYVGLTNNKERRHKEHCFGVYDGKEVKSVVYNHFKDCGSTVPNPIYLESNLTAQDAVKHEQFWAKFYEIELGYTLLNKAKCGSLGGGNVKWTKKNALTEALKYKTKKEFRENSSGAYGACVRNKWLNEVSHFENGNKPKGFWSIKLNVIEESKKYKTKQEFIKNGNGAYSSALKHGWVNEMVWLNGNHKPKGYWTKDRVFTESKKYTSYTDFFKHSKRAVRVALDNNWVKEMTWLTKTESRYKGYWTKETVFDTAKTCKNRKEFSKVYRQGYKVALNYGWLDELFPKQVQCNNDKGN